MTALPLSTTRGPADRLLFAGALAGPVFFASAGVLALSLRRSA